MMELIRIETGGTTLSNAESVIVVPEIAIKEPGYIQVFTTKDNAHAKHEYHAMAQMAYFQYQDEELEIREVATSLSVIPEDLQATGILISRENCVVAGLPLAEAVFKTVNQNWQQFF